MSVNHAAEFDAITIESLRRAGGVKWSMFPDAIGAFVAEMDFGTAPVVREALHDAVDTASLGYLPDALSREMSRACAEWHASRYGWGIDAEHIHPVADVIKGLEVAIEVPIAEEDGRYGYDLDGLDRAFADGAGLLIAQVIVSNDEDAAVWEENGMMAEHGASNLGVVANTAAFTSGGRWLDDVRGYLDENRRLLGSLRAERLPDVGYTMPEGTYLAWLDFRKTGLGDNPGEVIRDRAGVVLVDGVKCGEAGTGFVRLNFATPKPVLTEIVDRVAALVDGRR